MMNFAEPTVEAQPAIQLLATSSSRTLIPGAWQKPSPPSVTSAESSPLHSPSSHGAANLIVTLGPATEDGGTIRKLIKAGVRVFHLDGASAERDMALKAVYALRSISTELRQPVALLFDTGMAATPDEVLAKAHFGLECGADWFAVACEAETTMLKSVRQFLIEHKRGHIGVLARIGGGSDSKQVGAILADADGVLVSIPHPERDSTKRMQAIVMQCRAARKAVIFIVHGASEGVAFETVVKCLQPDAWLFAEVAGGNLFETVQQFDGLLSAPQPNGCNNAHPMVTLLSQRDETVAAAVRQADESNADAIILFTQSGRSAALCAALRPRRSRVIAFTPDTRLVRRLMLHGAIEPQALSFTDQSQKTVQAAEKLLLEKRILPLGTRLVVVTETQDEDQRVSSVQERTLEKV
jgi:pyruvate kinase